MRIIAGEFRGRRILPPEGMDTRPVTDRVKQSLFDILAPMLAGVGVYDCFAGTGSMGLEALSRGAEGTVFLEADRSAVALLRKNIEALGVKDRSHVVSTNLFKWFADAPASPLPHPPTVIFLDPPYRFLRERSDELRALAGRMVERHLGPEGVVVFRHDAEDSLELPPLVRFDQRIYGGMAIDFLRK